MAVAAVLERPHAEFFVASQAELVGRVMVQFDEAWRTIVAITAGEILAVIDVVEGNVAVIGLEGVGGLGGDGTGYENEYQKTVS